MYTHTQLLQHVTGASDPVPNGVVFDGSAAETATFTTAAISIRSAKTWALVFSCPSTGSPVGTWEVQGSIDPSKNPGRDTADGNVTVWVSLASSAVSGASTISVTGADSPWLWLRGVYTETSGEVTPKIRLGFKAEVV